jgi:MoxR-like ATPase
MRLPARFVVFHPHTVIAHESRTPLHFERIVEEKAMAASPTAANMLPDALRAALDRAQAQVNGLVLGKPQEVRLAFVALLANGHVLIEDLPGLGKTTLAHALAATLGLDFQRVQFTSDLLPADVVGVSVFDPQARSFQFHPGPVFTQVLLADEINRAPPRTQSALLESMAEHQVTVDGTTHALPEPFFVIATQNPIDLAGTYPLPDSQLDRFLLRLALGYPGEEAERDLLSGSDRRDLIAQSMPLLSAEDVIDARRAVQGVHASTTLIAYVQALLARSRKHPGVRVGLSPRAGLALLRASRAYALLLGRGHVLPEDVQALFGPVAAHRLVPDAQAGGGAALARSILHAVPVD